MSGFSYLIILTKIMNYMKITEINMVKKIKL